MDVLLNVILPVFLVIGIGYISVWRNWLSTENITSLTRFAQNFAIPCLLFYAIAKIEISENFNLPLLFNAPDIEIVLSLCASSAPFKG